MGFMGSRAPKLRILPTVVGINVYEHGAAGQFTTLSCAERDAQRIATFLREDNDAFEAVSFQPFLGMNATAERIRRDLRLRFTNARLTPQDVILFYFAGHGMVTSDRKAFLCCYGASPRDPTNDGLSLADLFNDSQIPQSDAMVMLILDACYSGAVADPNHINMNAAQQMRGLLRNMPALGRGSRVVLAASHADQAARENPMLDGGTGLFTREILLGWREGAARDKDGIVTPETLSQYLQGRFKDSLVQQPVTSVTTTNLLAIGRFDPPIPGQPVTPSQPKPMTRGAFDINAPEEIYQLPAQPPRKKPLGARRRRLVLAGAGALLALVAACAVITIINPLAFTLWLITAALLALASVPLAARAVGFLALPATLLALAQTIALIGLAHTVYHLGAGVAILDTIARYSWLAVAIFIVHTIFVVFYGVWVGANALWTSN